MDALTNDQPQSYADRPTAAPGDKPEFEVAIAIVRRADRWLVALRHDDAHLGGLWEFPGGKRERGEDILTTAIRELQEECGVEARVEAVLAAQTCDYPERIVRLTPVMCVWNSGDGEPHGSVECRWVTWDELEQLEMPAANAPIRAEIRRRLQQPLHHP